MHHFAALLCCVCFSLPAQAEILVGVAGPLTGQNAVYGNELRVGAAAAVATVNAAGGINGEPLAIVEGDDACDAKRAVEVANSFKNKDVRMIIGHFCTSASLAAAPIYNAAGIVMLNSSSTSPDLTSKNLWNVFRLTGRDDAQADFAAARIKAEGQNGDVFLITDGQVETSNIVKRFLSALPNTKVMTVKAGAVRLPDDPGLIVASTVYFALQGVDAAEAAKSIRKLNPTAQFYGPDLLQSESFGTKAETAGNNARISFLRDNSTIANPAILSKLPQSEGATLAAYAAVEVFVAAAKARSINDGKAIATWLTTGNEVPTVIGNLHFNASGDLQQQPYVWYKWTDGVLSPESP